MGSGGVDIIMSPRARECFPFSIECKAWKAKPGPAQIEQSKYNAYDDTLPIVVWKPHGKGPQHALVMLEFETLLEFWREHSANEEDCEEDNPKEAKGADDQEGE